MPKRAALSGDGLDVLFERSQNTSKPENRKASNPANLQSGKTASKKISTPERQRLRKKAAEQNPVAASLQNPDPHKVKETYYISENVAILLEDLRLRLRREHGLRPSQASKSSIVEAALEILAEDTAALADKLLAG